MSWRLSTNNRKPPNNAPPSACGPVRIRPTGAHRPDTTNQPTKRPTNQTTNQLTEKKINMTNIKVTVDVKQAIAAGNNVPQSQVRMEVDVTQLSEAERNFLGRVLEPDTLTVPSAPALDGTIVRLKVVEATPEGFRAMLQAGMAELQAAVAKERQSDMSALHDYRELFWDCVVKQLPALTQSQAHVMVNDREQEFTYDQYRLRYPYIPSHLAKRAKAEIDDLMERPETLAALAEYAKRTEASRVECRQKRIEYLEGVAEGKATAAKKEADITAVRQTVFNKHATEMQKEMATAGLLSDARQEAIVLQALFGGSGHTVFDAGGKEYETLGVDEDMYVFFKNLREKLKAATDDDVAVEISLLGAYQYPAEEQEPWEENALGPRTLYVDVTLQLKDSPDSCSLTCRIEVLYQE